MLAQSVLDGYNVRHIDLFDKPKLMVRSASLHMVRLGPVNRGRWRVAK